MTAPLKVIRPSTLSRPKAGSVQWDAAMMAELEACARADLPVTETSARLGVAHSTVARGALLRLQQLLQAREAAE